MDLRSALWACLCFTLVLNVGSGCSGGGGEETPTSPTPAEDADGDGFKPSDGDCDETNPFINPDATDVPYDGIDQDCSGADVTDQDQDGFDAVQVQGEDCNDVSADSYPGAPELADGLDNNCNGAVDEGVNSVDNDGDGYSEAEGDCNDLDPDVSPATEEIPYDGIDQDCSGADEVDVDQDGVPGGGFGDDCDDLDPNTFPGADEFADGKDNDCDEEIDEGLDTTDDDGDGYSEAQGDCNDGDPLSFPGGEDIPYDGLDQDCSGSDLDDIDEDGFGGGEEGLDCNDSDSSINPEGLEIPYDAIDQDCSGADLSDVDGDGFASVKVPGGTDCNDDDPLVSPSGIEIPYDGIDQDCSGADQLDADGDGFAATVAGGTDCDDIQSSIHPEASELCDGIDNNCDGVIDTNAVDRNTYYLDSDQDSFGDPNTPRKACAPSASLVENQADCDDTNADVHPNSVELCDGIDNNCDGSTDEGVQSTYYRDEDGDDFGSLDQVVLGCEAPAGYVAASTDCDDLSSTRYPGAAESCNLLDDDCDGLTDEDVKSTFYADADQDGYGNPVSSTLACTAPTGYVADNTDCKDTNDTINPGAGERCNGIDDNCNDQIDETVASVYYLDADHDGYGDPDSSITDCNASSSYVSNGDDCNDGNGTIHPGVQEQCDGIDNNCDAKVDEGVKPSYYQDLDGDGYGNPAIFTLACSAPIGYVSDDTDCADSNSAVNPGATEICNGIDDNCDGISDGAAGISYYQDQDGDSFGDPQTSQQACSQPSGYVANNDDCDDDSAAVYPGASETCNGMDDDCDTQVDEGVQSTWYRDQDGDSFGDPNRTTLACSRPTGYVADNTDCRDTNDLIYPGATELCNAADDDCDGVIDENLGTTYYQDSDGDGFGNASSTRQACLGIPAGYVSDATDCDDGNASIHPGAAEVMNGVDDDCDGYIDIHSSCKAIKAANPAATSGVYTIDPDGGSGAKTPFEVYCDMSIAGGGWTLVAIMTNGDSSRNWTVRGSNWVTSSTFGTPTSPTTNVDAKSRAYSELAADEVLIMRPGVVEVRSNTSCLGTRTMLTIMRRNSEDDDNCAWQCSTAEAAAPWSGQSYQDSNLRFRCKDNDGDTVDGAGFIIGSDDNSMVTTFVNGTYHDYNFGLGAGYGGSEVDFDQTTSDANDAGNATQRLFYLR